MRLPKSPYHCRWLGFGIPLILILAACDSTEDPTGPGTHEDPVPASLVVGPAEVELFSMHTFTLSTFVKDENGGALPNDNVVLQSRDSTTVLVVDRARIQARAAGETWILALLGNLRDSVHVTVRYPVVEGQAKARVLGEEDYEVEWVAEGIFLDFMSTEEGDLFMLTLANTADADSGIVVVMPQEPPAGRTDLAEMTIDAFLDGYSSPDQEEPLAFLFTSTEEETRIYLALEGSFLDLDQVSPAPGLGLEGSLEGRLVLRAAGYRLFDTGWGGDVSAHPTGDTVMVYGDMSAGCLHWGVGQATLTLEGGPVAGVYPGAEAWLTEAWWDDEGLYSITLELDDFDGYIATPFPEIGEFALDSMGLDGVADQDSRYFQLEDWSWNDDWEYAWNTDGTLTIEEVVPSDGEVWGEVKGEMTANLVYTPAWGLPPNDEGSISVEFHAVQMPDLFLVPPQVTRAQERNRWLRPLPLPGLERRKRELR